MSSMRLGIEDTVANLKHVLWVLMKFTLKGNSRQPSGITICLA